MDRLRSITLPPVLDANAAREVVAAIEAALGDPAGPCIIITGSSGVFCKGLDLAALDEDGDGRDNALQSFARALQLLHQASKPTVAAVDGEALGGGVGLAAACDVVVVSDRSGFALPEALFGLIPGMIAPYLLNRMTVQQVKLWAISGERHSAAAALAAGLADEVVAADGLMTAADRWTKRLGRARPHTVARLKTFLAEAAVDPQGSSARGLLALRAALADRETLARLRHFAETGTLPWDDS